MTDTLPYVIAGLGNPGAEYAGTRHNIGFDIIDLAAKKTGAGAFRRDGDADCARVSYRGTDIVFVRPLTFMNASGRAVRRIADACGTVLERILIVLDDVNLPLGSMRVRPGGSAGGHNGLASVIVELNTDRIARLRVGVGAAGQPAGDLIPFVLGQFSASERVNAVTVVRHAAEAVAAFAVGSVESVMNEFNNKSFLPQNT